MASRRDGVLYVGATSNLVGRVWQHKNNVVESFSKRYGVHTLVWFEPHDCMENAILREKRIKNWKRARKIQLIETMNPLWEDLYPTLL
ncbi:GIY-YIG nuclease family protein [Nocardia thraciensis]